MSPRKRSLADKVKAARAAMPQAARSYAKVAAQLGCSHSFLWQVEHQETAAIPHKRPSLVNVGRWCRVLGLVREDFYPELAEN